MIEFIIDLLYIKYHISTKYGNASQEKEDEPSVADYNYPKNQNQRTSRAIYPTDDTARVRYEPRKTNRSPQGP